MDRFKKLPVIGILRGIEKDIVEQLVEIIVSSGLKTIEVTMNTQNAPEIIKAMVRQADGRLAIGAGTVLTREDLSLALDSGATFIVSPTLVTGVVEYCAKSNIPVFPGALTPQEIYNSWKAGATMVKIFPAGSFGPAYFKEIKAPFREIELLACGGVTAGNISSYFLNGASAVAFGASIFKKEWLKAREFSKIEGSIREFITAIK